MMNIKQHIEAGHYPKPCGVTEVRTRGGNTAFIYTTKHHPDWPIVGGIDGESEPFAWMTNGRISTSGTASNDLLPPAPLKVEVKVWGAFGKTSHRFYSAHANKEDVGKHHGLACVDVIELIGSYEEPWT